ncbi:MAG: lytic transglycosylase domain-containing protein [bacterium]
MAPIESTTWRAGRRALEKALALYLDDPNVTLVDLGFRLRTSAPNGFTPELAVRIHVRNELAHKVREELAAEASLRLGFAVEIIAANYDLHFHRDVPEQMMALHEKDVSSILHSRPPEKFGGRVRDRQSGEELMLCSWHVLANSRVGGGDFPIDQSVSTNGNKPIRSAIYAGLDAAVIRLREANPLWTIATANGAVIPQLGMHVIKSGGGASEAGGIVAGIFGYCIQQDGGNKTLFGPLVHIIPNERGERICKFGDSGAWWVETSTQRATALHFAGSHDPSLALAFPMPEVLETLEVEVVAAPEISFWQSSEQFSQAAASEAVNAIAAAIPKLSLSRATRRVYQIACAGLLLTLVVMISGFYFHLQNGHSQQQAQILQLHGQLQDLKTIARVDRTRQHHIRRIIAIIDRFNRKMESESKFRLAAEIYEMSLKYNRLEVELICATITHESGRTWSPEAVSPAGALGLMQILPTTGIYLAKAEGLTWTSAESILFDPIYNLRLGCRYLSDLISAYGVEAGLAAYNGGDRQAKLWLQGERARQLMHAETTYYVPAVLRIYEEYRRAAM